MNAYFYVLTFLTFLALMMVFQLREHKEGIWLDNAVETYYEDLNTDFNTSVLNAYSDVKKNK